MATYNLVVDDDKMNIKPEDLFKMYSDIDANARQSADARIKHELRISRDGRKKTRFYIAVSDRMAPHLLSAVQRQAESEFSSGLKTYFDKLQEQLMTQMFAGASDQINIKFG